MPILFELCDANQVLSATRADMERNFQYCGFLVLENRLKPETRSFLATHSGARLRCDNALTVVSIAR